LRQDFIGGLVVMAVAAFAFWQGADLSIGTLGGMGPGMLPRGLAVLLGLLGVLLAADAVIEGGGAALDRWSLRGPFFVAIVEGREHGAGDPPSALNKLSQRSLLRPSERRGAAFRASLFGIVGRRGAPCKIVK
jgi:Tripartite tricarboxylate transporter TctB family